MDNTTNTRNQGSSSANLLLLIVPDMVTTDPTTVGKVNKAFDSVGTLHEVARGVFYIVTDKAIASWGDQVKSQLGTDLRFFVFPVNASNLQMYRAYLPTDMHTIISQGIRAA